MVVKDFILQERSRLVKSIAREAGFEYCGISAAGFLEEHAARLESWLSRNYQGQMAWMSNHFDKRLDPTLLVDGARSVVSVLFNYYPEEKLPEGTDSYKISKYAYGKDYHEVIRTRLKVFLAEINERIGEVGGRVFIDSAPVMDKAWAEKSGLGWVGKHTNLINRDIGSFFFIGELIIDLELWPDEGVKDYCGTCTRCIDACPTDAISEPYEVDGSKCISYYTIELKEAIPEEVRGKFGNWIFGCDICQDVCPWNRFAKPARMGEFAPDERLKEFSNPDWEEITEEVFRDLFRRSAIRRAGFEGLKRNIRFVKNTEEP